MDSPLLVLSVLTNSLLLFSFFSIGNPQAVGQTPVTYYRQVLALSDLPAQDGVDHPNVEQMFPPDVVQRAREIRDKVGPAGTGAYSGSKGILGFRKDVARYIEERDGHPAFAGNIFLTNGASSVRNLCLHTKAIIFYLHFIKEN